jgi:hypothetical protein
MEFLGDVALVESHFGLESFWTHQMELLGDEAQVEARFGLFRVSAYHNA